jgi:hypothetical protein
MLGERNNTASSRFRAELTRLPHDPGPRFTPSSSLSTPSTGPRCPERGSHRPQRNTVTLSNHGPPGRWDGRRARPATGTPEGGAASRSRPGRAVGQVRTEAGGIVSRRRRPRAIDQGAHRRGDAGDRRLVQSVADRPEAASLLHGFRNCRSVSASSNIDSSSDPRAAERPDPRPCALLSIDDKPWNRALRIHRRWGGSLPLVGTPVLFADSGTDRHWPLWNRCCGDASTRQTTDYDAGS